MTYIILPRTLPQNSQVPLHTWFLSSKHERSGPCLGVTVIFMTRDYADKLSSRGCTLTYIQWDSHSHECARTHKHIYHSPLGNKHLILKCLWNGCSWAATGADKKCRKRKRDFSWPELSFLDFRVSESLGFLASLLGMLLMAGTAIQVCSGFQAKVWAPPSPRSHSREGKTSQLGALDLSNSKTPSPACTLLCASTYVLWGVKNTGQGGRVVGKEGIFADGGGKENNRANFPTLVWAHTTDTHFSIQENNNSFIQPVWTHQSLIIDFRHGWKVGKVWVAGKWGGEWEEEGGKPIKERVGVGGMA